MDLQQLPSTLAGLTRRDFLKFLSVTGGAVLLGGCAAHAPATPSVPSPQNDTPDLPPTGELESTETTTITETPSATDTPSQTPEPPPVYLPAADGSVPAYALPAPQFPNFMPLAQALQERHSSRTFRPDELPVPALSALLWAGFGVNRPDGKRTAPSAYNVRDIDIYLATGKGLFRYEAANHNLSVLLPDDLRLFTGMQEFVAAAPLNLVYVSDYSRMDTSDEEGQRWSWAHSGCIAQNIYLACAALGLATVVRSTIDREELGRRMGLSGSQHITLAQTVGYPAE